MTKARTLGRAAAAHGLARLRRRPHITSVTLFLTLRCNCSCWYCDFPSMARGQDWDGDRFISLLDGLARHGTARVGLSGGEPLLHPDFDRIAYAAAARGFLTSLVTNGLLLGEHLDAAASMDYVLCTIEGDSEQHDSIRGPGARDAALDAMRMLARRQRKRPRLGIICPLHQGNDNVEEVLRVAEDLGATAFFQPVQLRKAWAGEAFDGLPVDADTKAQFQRLLTERRKGRPVGNSPQHLRWVAEGFPAGFGDRCLAGRYFHTVLPDGALLPCCMVDWEEHRTILEPSSPGDALRDHPPTCDGCSILPYVDNTLLMRPSLRALANALRW